MAKHMQAAFCVEALENTCRGTGGRGLIQYPDCGSQFISWLFRAALQRHEIRQSMGGAGRCYENAFAALKMLYPVDTTSLSRTAVKSIVFRSIHYYNLRRIISVNDGLPPLVYRKNFFEAISQPTA